LEELPESGLAVLDDLWKQDSTTVQWALAFMIGNDFAYTRREAIVAGALYKSYWGRGSPVLMSAILSMDENRRAEALRAVRMPLTPQEELVALRYGCDAAWQLLALNSDTVYTRALLSAHWALRASEVLYGAYAVLGRSGRDVLKPLILQLEPETAAVRLREIEAVSHRP
jgi:hypothetical protein